MSGRTAGSTPATGALRRTTSSSAAAQAEPLAIVARDGTVAWRLGPNFLESEELRAIRQIIGQHHPHLIPRVCPEQEPDGLRQRRGERLRPAEWSRPRPPIFQRPARAYSKSTRNDEACLVLHGREFFSSNISGAQRLANGNTLITEGARGRLFEVTSDRQIVWEYIYPVFGGANASNAVYRGYRVPYDWIRQIARPAERAVVPPPIADFRVP